MAREAERTLCWRPGKAVGGTSVNVWRPENQEGQRPRAGRDGQPSSSKEWILPSFVFLSYLGPLGIARCPLIFTQSYYSLAAWLCPTLLLPHGLLCSWDFPRKHTGVVCHWSKCYRNTFIDTPQNSVLPALWAPLSPAKLTHKISQVDTLHQLKQNYKHILCVSPNIKYFYIVHEELLQMQWCTLAINFNNSQLSPIEGRFGFWKTAKSNSEPSLCRWFWDLKPSESCNVSDSLRKYCFWLRHDFLPTLLNWPRKAVLKE